MRTMILPVLILGGLAAGVCQQDTANSQGQLSLADLARRESKKTKQQEQPKTVVVADERASRPAPVQGDEARPVDERPPVAPSGLPDLVLQGGSNIDDIIQALEIIKTQRGPAEAESALRRWYDKHDALLLAALKDMDGLAVKANPNGDQAARSLQGAATSLRIQSAFLRVISEFPKLEFRPEWFKVHCSESNFAPCR